MYVCLWSPDWSTAGASGADGGRGQGAGGADRSTGDDAAPPSSYDLAPLLAELAPRIRVESEIIWADGRGLDATALARQLVERLTTEGVSARAGIASVPVTAELAARRGPGAGPGTGKRPSDPTTFLVKERTGWGHRKGKPEEKAEDPQSPPPCPEGAAAGDDAAISRAHGCNEAGHPPSGNGGVVVVERGGEAEWQSGLPITALRPSDRIRTLLEGVGITTVGQLAGLEREAVEVRFGGDAVALWRHARADDRRLLFDRIPAGRPHGSIDFVDYVLTDPSRLLFTANALLGPICDRLTERGEHARTLHLELPLANGESWERTLRPARPTASRETWLRLMRGLLDRLTVPDAVTGMEIEVPSTEAAAVRQGDLFDRGFATASAVEAAVARLAERQLWPVVPETDAHPALERRDSWERQDLGEAVSAHSPGREPGTDGAGASEEGRLDSRSRGREQRGLSLQLMPEPRRVVVETERRRDHEVPTRIRDRQGWQEVAHAAGPDRISGGQWETSSYAREYYRCVTDQGVPLWIFRDALSDDWYLQGWWD